MKNVKAIPTIIGIFMFLFYCGKSSGDSPNSGVSQSQQTNSQTQQTKTQQTKTQQTKTQQTKTKTQQTKTKTQPAKTKSQTTGTKTQKTTASTKPVKKAEVAGTVTIGTQIWSVSNLNVATFRNGDSIPEAKTFQEWSTAGYAKKPAWCYFNNDSANGRKYGKLYNWYAVNDPRGLAPSGWAIPTDEDWAKLTYFLGGLDIAGDKIKSTSEWQGGYNGTNETGFNGFPSGYRVENGAFMNLGNNAVWWSSTESNTLNAYDYYLGQRGRLEKSGSPKQRGSSVRCLRK